MSASVLACADVRSGNGKTAGRLEMPGLVAWVHSVPSASDEGGGDVHYVSVCPSCIVSHVALADVSGHGQAVEVVGEKLRELMIRYLPDLEQTGLMRDLNRAVREELDSVHYATMIAAGWHGPRRLLVLTNAGHPPPFRYRAAGDEWSWIDGRRAGQRGRVAGVPLGLLDDSSYDRVALKPEAWDLVVLYSDGVSEAANEDGVELGRAGLLSLARGLDTSSAEAFGSQLAAALRRFRGRAKAGDDATLIVLQRVPVAAAV